MNKGKKGIERWSGWREKLPGQVSRNRGNAGPAGVAPIGQGGMGAGTYTKGARPLEMQRLLPLAREGWGAGLPTALGVDG